MNKIDFLNKIAAFYPCNANSDHKPIFYMSFDEAPLQMSLCLNTVLGGLNPKNDYILNLKVIDSNKIEKINTNNEIKGSTLNKNNFISEENITTAGFAITNTMTVENGIHFYTATLTLKDKEGATWDKATTWFLTRPDPDKEH